MALAIAERLVEIAVSLLIVWPAARYLLRLQRRDRWSAKIIAAAVLLAAYVGIVGFGALYAPLLLRVTAAFAMLVFGAFLWRSRSGYGRRRGLPPGSLAPTSDRPFTDRDYYLKQQAEHGTVFKASPGLFRPYACIVGHAAALEFLKANESGLTAPTPPYNANIPKGFLRYMGEEDHRDYRRLFQAAMPPPLVALNEPAVRSVIRASLARWASDGSGQAGIAVEPAVTAMMFAVMARLFFGIAASDPRYGQLHGLHQKIAYGDNGQYDHRQAEPALIALERLLFADAKAPPGDTIVAAVVADRPAAAEDPTIRRNLIYMLETAHRDMAGLLTWVLKLLLENGTWLQRLQAELRAARPLQQDRRGRSLADRVIMESLRLERSEYLYRAAAADLRIGPYRIPKSWIIRICIREGHRTNPVFDRPNQFDPDRFRDRTFDRTEYAPFGLYQRRCIGQNIVADVGRLFLEELCRSYDVEIAEDGPVQYRNGHWAPNTAFRLRLRPAE